MCTRTRGKTSEAVLCCVNRVKPEVVFMSLWMCLLLCLVFESRNKALSRITGITSLITTVYGTCVHTAMAPTRQRSLASK